jgi:hypothetical protein
MKISFKDAAKKILQSEGRPLSASEITELALEKNLIDTDGQTPSATMAAQIYMDLKNNPNSEFLKIKAGLFSLKRSKGNQSGHEYIARHNQEVTEKLREHLHQIDPKEFEYLIAALLNKIGFENVEVVGGSGDGGIDLVADLTVGGVTNVRTEIQAKRYRNNIGSKCIRELRGSAELTKRGLIITTSDFSKDAIEEAGLPNKMPISLVNGERLVELLIEHGVGVKKSQIELLAIDNNFLENVPDSPTMRPGSEGRSLSLWPLPGGTMEYMNTLLAFIGFVAKSVPSVDEATKWFIKSYSTVESPKTAKSYTGVPRSMRLIENINGKLVLTQRGTDLLANPTKLELLKVLEETILGVSEIIEALERQPMTEKEIFIYLTESLDLSWETYAQTRFRLIWLQNVGKILKSSNTGQYSIIKA